jgi:flagellar hook protein FlgE
MSTFSTAITGLKAYQRMIDVTGDDIANANTPGFKASRAEFADLLVQTLRGATAPSGTIGGTDPVQIGAGVGLSAVDILQTQGTIEPTGRPSDLAIQGNGFFVLSDGLKNVYTRAGTFKVDANGKLVDSGTGFLVQGSNGDISIPLGTNPPTPTTAVRLTGNLDANAADGTTVDSSFFVIDSLSGQNLVTVTFTKSASGGAGEWGYDVIDSSLPASAAPIGIGTITFASGGDIQTVTGAFASGGTVTLTPADGAGDVLFSVDFGSAGRSTSMTGFVAPSSVSMVSQDGVPQGSLISFAVGSDGKVTGIYSNGKSVLIDTLKLASFANPSGLLRLSNNQFGEMPDSGAAILGTAGTGGRGTIAAGALEQSNVDLATEFVNLIIAQRGYESNARVVTVADQITQTTVNLVR